jgi:hypothetical protein
VGTEVPGVATADVAGGTVGAVQLEEAPGTAAAAVGVPADTGAPGGGVEAALFFWERPKRRSRKMLPTTSTRKSTTTTTTTTV